MLNCYDIRTDRKTSHLVLTLRASVETWRETHQYRRLQKYQRTEGHGKTQTPVISAVYDDSGRLLCTP